MQYSTSLHNMNLFIQNIPHNVYYLYQLDKFLFNWVQKPECETISLLFISHIMRLKQGKLSSELFLPLFPFVQKSKGLSLDFIFEFVNIMMDQI